MESLGLLPRGPGASPFRAAPPFARALVVANPIAGRGRGQAAGEELARGLASLGIPAELHLTRGRGDGTARVRAAEREVDLVFAVGGDGTLGEVLEGVGQRDMTVGLLPLGTANLLAVQFGLPRDIPRVLETVAGRRTATVDTARVNGGLCFLCAGVGLDGWIVEEVERRRRGAIRKWSYVSAAARVLTHYRAPQLTVEVDGKALDGTYGFALVSNLRIYGAFFRLAADAQPDDQLLEVYALRKGDLPRLLGLGVWGLFSRWPGPMGRMVRGRQVRIRSDREVAIQVDGDYRGVTPMELTLAPERHRILVPSDPRPTRSRSNLS